MDANNPYSSPKSNLFGTTGEAGGNGVTNGVMLQLQKTKPWVRFISVLMFIMAGILIVVGIVMVTMGAAFMGAATARGPAGSSGGAALGPGFVAGMAAGYIIMALFHIYPALKLWKYANRIRDLLSSQQVLDLENALNEQRAFWKFVGVMTIVLITLYIVIIVAAVATGVAARAG